MRRIRYEEWVREGEFNFGDVRSNWRFKCPQCGNVQSGKDFVRYKGQGAEMSTASQECIGRYNGRQEGDGLPGCRFTLATQPQLAGVVVVYGIGHETLMMDFSEE